MPFCSKCGANMDKSDVFCRLCGHKLTQTDTDAQSDDDNFISFDDITEDEFFSDIFEEIDNSTDASSKENTIESTEPEYIPFDDDPYFSFDETEEEPSLSEQPEQEISREDPTQKADGNPFKNRIHKTKSVILSETADDGRDHEEAAPEKNVAEVVSEPANAEGKVTSPGKKRRRVSMREEERKLELQGLKSVEELKNSLKTEKPEPDDEKASGLLEKKHRTIEESANTRYADEIEDKHRADTFKENIASNDDEENEGRRKLELKPSKRRKRERNYEEIDLYKLEQEKAEISDSDYDGYYETILPVDHDRDIKSNFTPKRILTIIGCLAVLLGVIIYMASKITAAMNL